MAHITGGGITENLPRVLPEGCGAVVDPRAWVVPSLFRMLQERGGIASDEMFRTFNMGIGMTLVCARESRDDVMRALPDARVIGTVVRGVGVAY